MNRFLFVSIVSCTLILGATGLRAEDHVKAASTPAPTNQVAVAGKPQTSCPVTGETLTSKDLFVDVEGKRIYLCCASCKGRVQKNPAKYIKQMEAAGIALEVAPAKPATK